MPSIKVGKYKQVMMVKTDWQTDRRTGMQINTRKTKLYFTDKHR